MNLRRGANPSIHCADRPTQRFAAGDELTPGIGNRGVDWQDALSEAVRQLVGEPSIEALATLPRRQPLDAVTQFGQGDDADEDTILVGLGQPRDDAGIGPRLHPFRHGIRVEQKAHKSTLRGASLRRVTFRPGRRNGEAAKNSARWPRRFVLRSHSSAATTTTARRPLRVMVCGPLKRARSITSLNFAFASAMLQS